MNGLRFTTCWNFQFLSFVEHFSTYTTIFTSNWTLFISWWYLHVKLNTFFEHIVVNTSQNNLDILKSSNHLSKKAITFHIKPDTHSLRRLKFVYHENWLSLSWKLLNSPFPKRRTQRLKLYIIFIFMIGRITYLFQNLFQSAGKQQIFGLLEE